MSRLKFLDQVLNDNTERFVKLKNCLVCIHPIKCFMTMKFRYRIKNKEILVRNNYSLFCL